MVQRRLTNGSREGSISFLYVFAFRPAIGLLVYFSTLDGYPNACYGWDPGYQGDS